MLQILFILFLTLRMNITTIIDTANEFMYNLEESIEDLNLEPYNLHDDNASSSNSSKRSDSPISLSFSSISGIVLL